MFSGAAVRYSFILIYSFYMVFSVGMAWAEPVGTASQGGEVAPSCEPGVMKAIENQAAMQATQDVETTQNIVSKPDSVLEYTCFDQYASVTATQGGEIFSDADMAVDTGGLPGDAFFELLVDGTLGDVLASLLPDEFFQIMDLMSGLDTASILLQMSSAELQQALGNVSVNVQVELHDKILSELPPEADMYLTADIATQPLDKLVGQLNKIPVNVSAAIIPEMTNAELENFLGMLPTDALEELMGGLTIDIGIGGDSNEKNLDNVLEGVVLGSLQSYTDANFDHSFLGGRVDADYDPSATVGSGRYNCDRMNAVWQMAKCQNFEAIPEQDGFKTMTDYAAGGDPRQLPEACQKSPKWAGMHNAAVGEPAWQSDSWKNNQEPAYVKESDGKDCSKAKIVKGRELIGPDGNVMAASYTCSAPGCVYKSGSCVKAP